MCTEKSCLTRSLSHPSCPLSVDPRLWHIWLWRLDFKTKVNLWKIIQKRSMPGIDDLEILCCEEDLNERSDLMERKGEYCNSLQISVRMLYNGRKPPAFQVHCGKIGLVERGARKVRVRSVVGRMKYCRKLCGEAESPASSVGRTLRSMQIGMTLLWRNLVTSLIILCKQNSWCDTECRVL